MDDIVTKTLTVGSRGGGEFCTPVLHQFVTVCKHSHPDLFPEEMNFSTCYAYADAPGMPPMPPPEDTNMNIISDHDNHTYCIMNPRNDVDLEYAQLVQKKRKKRQEKKVVGLMANKKNILHLIDRATLMDIFKNLDDLTLDEEGTTEELLSHVLLNECCKLLPDVIAELQYSDWVKWGSTNIEELYPLLMDSGQMMVQCTIKDLNVICKMLEHHTDRCWYTSGVLKAVMVNKICKVFGGTNSVHEGSTRKSNKVYNPQLLRSSAKEVLLTSDYKVEHL